MGQGSTTHLFRLSPHDTKWLPFRSPTALWEYSSEQNHVMVHCAVALRDSSVFVSK